MALGHYERLGKLPAESPYRKYALTAMGYKFRIHPAAAAMARVRLRHFDEVNGQRNRNMDYLDKELGAVPGFLATEVPADSRRSYYGYRLRYDPDAMGGAGRPSVMAALQAEGVQVSGWDFPLQHQQPFYREARQQVAKLVGRDIPDVEVRLPVTEQVLERLLSLPTFPRGTQELLDQYVHAFRKVSAGWREIPPFEERQREPVDRSLRTIR
jgi:dTDP-4-amino-4,6-dideoxygalactose transaminase